MHTLCVKIWLVTKEIGPRLLTWVNIMLLFIGCLSKSCWKLFSLHRRLSDVLKWKRPPKRAVGRKSKYASNDDSNTAPSPFDVLEAHHTRLSGMTGGNKSTPTGRPSASAKGKAAVGMCHHEGINAICRVALGPREGQVLHPLTEGSVLLNSPPSTLPHSQDCYSRLRLTKDRWGG